MSTLDMSETNFVATIACVEAMKHTEPIIEFFKSVKNGKSFKSKMKLFLETIANPSTFTESEIKTVSMLVSVDFFKNDSNTDLKQKVTGLMIRLNCSRSFCEKIVNIPLSSFNITPSMAECAQLLKQFFKPVVLKIITSKKSHSVSQINLFKNITFEQFELIKNEKVKLSRNMGKFEVWTIKKEQEQFIFCEINHVDESESVADDHRIDGSETVVNNYHVDQNEVVFNDHLHDTDNIPIDTMLQDINENIDTALCYDDITNYFSSFCG